MPLRPNWIVPEIRAELFHQRVVHAAPAEGAFRFDATRAPRCNSFSRGSKFGLDAARQENEFELKQDGRRRVSQLLFIADLSSSSSLKGIYPNRLNRRGEFRRDVVNSERTGRRPRLSVL